MTLHVLSLRASCNREICPIVLVSDEMRGGCAFGPRRHHWFALILTIMLFTIAAPKVFAETPVIAAPEAARKLASGDLVLLDIRSPEEWRETGIADGAWPVSMHRPDFAQRMQKILSVHGASHIALICATGGRSAYVADVLAKNGISGVWDVSEGMFGNGTAPGWIARGLNVVSLNDAMARYKMATSYLEN